MNESQRKVLIGAAVAVGLMLLFPPLEFGEVGLGYGFLFSRHGGASVNLGLLFAQWIAVGVLGGIALVLLRVRT